MNADQWSIDITYNLGDSDRLHGYYALYRTSNTEPTRNGNTIPGFGNNSRQQRQVSANYTHVFGPTLVNEIDLALIVFTPLQRRMRNWTLSNLVLTMALPTLSVCRKISVAGGLNFGGPAINPSGRGDTTSCNR